MSFVVYAAVAPYVVRKFFERSLVHATFTLSKDKPRLYLALYERGAASSSSSYASSITCDSYHWALLIGPQTPDRDDPGTRYQIVHTEPYATSRTPCETFLYEETDLSQVSQAQSQSLLVRITLAKVTNEARLQHLLRSLPSSSQPPSSHSVPSDSGYDTDDLHASITCLTWVKEAYKTIAKDTRCLRGYIGPDDWPEVEEVARTYARRKRRQGRFGGQPRIDPYATWNDDEIPTWNFWENRETTS